MSVLIVLSQKQQRMWLSVCAPAESCPTKIFITITFTPFSSVQKQPHHPGVTLWSQLMDTVSLEPNRMGNRLSWLIFLVTFKLEGCEL